MSEHEPDLTLLALSGAILEVVEDDEEADAALDHLIRSGRVKLVRRP